MGRGISGVKKNLYIASVVAGIVILLVFAVGCSGDLLGYIKDMIAQADECKGIIDLPKTGQTTCYDSSGTVIPCSDTGQDGDLQMGVAWPDPRFTDNGDTITDNLTGLMWDKSGDTSSGQRTWTEALSDCNGLDLGGHNDWRLPNRKELRSLLNYEEANQANWLNTVAQDDFDNVQSNYYWSSTTYAPGTSSAWVVYMVSGYVYSNTKTTDRYVLAVRAGQAGGAVSLPKTGQTTSYATGDDGDLEKGVAWPSERFTDNGGGTITDNLTGLMWEQAPSDTALTWANALTYANDLDLGGHSDWRLPNVNELESLINVGQVDPEAWLNWQGFSNVQASIYLSSTTHVQNPPNAWVTYMIAGGSMDLHPKTNNTSYALAVRAGQ